MTEQNINGRIKQISKNIRANSYLKAASQNWFKSPHDEVQRKDFIWWISSLKWSYSFNKYLLIILCGRHASQCWGHSNEQNLYLHGVCILLKGDKQGVMMISAEKKMQSKKQGLELYKKLFWTWMSRERLSHQVVS